MKRLATVGAALLTVTLGAGAASADPERPTPTESEIRASVLDIDLDILDIELNVTELDTETSDGDETVISLTTDVLFDFDKADLPPNASAKIEEILADVPEGTAVTVGGHTDSLGSDERNAELSLERAQAVADVIAEVRPDLDLDVQGFGPDQPVADNTIGGEDNPEGRAQNRRVEIRYAD